MRSVAVHSDSTITAVEGNRDCDLLPNPIIRMLFRLTKEIALSSMLITEVTLLGTRASLLRRFLSLGLLRILMSQVLARTNYRIPGSPQKTTCWTRRPPSSVSRKLRRRVTTSSVRIWLKVWSRAPAPTAAHWTLTTVSSIWVMRSTQRDLLSQATFRCLIKRRVVMPSKAWKTEVQDSHSSITQRCQRLESRWQVRSVPMLATHSPKLMIDSTLRQWRNRALRLMYTTLEIPSDMMITHVRVLTRLQRCCELHSVERTDLTNLIRA